MGKGLVGFGHPVHVVLASDGAPAQRSNSNNRSKEIDRILDKISEHGYESLSDEEKKTLYEASQS